MSPSQRLAVGATSDVCSLFVLLIRRIPPRVDAVDVTNCTLVS